MIAYDLSMPDYLKNPNHGSTGFRKILESPQDFLAAQEQENEETKGTFRGTVCHTAIIEPHLLDKEYLFQKEDWGPRNKGDGSKKWRDLKKQAEDEGKSPVSYEDYVFMNKLILKVESIPYLVDLISRARGEVTAFCEFDGIPLKARADLLIAKENIIWDIKTTAKGIDDLSLSKTIFDHGYHFQMAHQMQVFLENDIDVTKWGWIFISTNTPALHISMKTASENVIKAGFNDFMYAVELYQQCVDTGNWWGYSNEKPEPIGLPAYTDKFYD
jgi:hypothetical protein